MTLKRFCRKYIKPNSLIRLHERTKDGFRAYADEDGTTVGMEHGILTGTGWQAKYARRQVECVADILWEDGYPEAINIVIM